MLEIENDLPSWIRTYCSSINSACMALEKVIQRIKIWWRGMLACRDKPKPFTEYKKMVSQPYWRPVLRVARSRL